MGCTKNCVLEIHGFRDASKEAMCASIYLRILNNSYCTMHLLISKVAPIKTQTTARLEFCAALLLSKLVDSILDLLHISKYPVYLWSDSMVTLAWIKSSPHFWQPFISHRVAEIQKLTSNVHWHHIDGKLNPADLATRDISQSSGQLKSWWHGPELLNNNNKAYSLHSNEFSCSECPERLKSCLIVHIN